MIRPHNPGGAPPAMPPSACGIARWRSLLRGSLQVYLLSGSIILLAGGVAAQTDDRLRLMPPQEGQYRHSPPTIESLKTDSEIHPELRKVILQGYDIFTNTQQFRGRYVFNDMNCKSCHPGGGREAWSGPVWPVATTFPAFRRKNLHVNSLEERISGCSRRSGAITPTTGAPG